MKFSNLVFIRHQKGQRPKPSPGEIFNELFENPQNPMDLDSVGNLFSLNYTFSTSAENDNSCEIDIDKNFSLLY